MNYTNKRIIFAITLLALAASTYAQSPPEVLLQEMVQLLQTTPDNNELREKIIKLGAEIKPAPSIPEEANRAFIKGNVFQKESKDAIGYELAISAYRDALRVAPWWGDAYFNLAVALELADNFDEAIASMKLYLTSIPVGSMEARDAQNRIYAIEAKSEMASQYAIATVQQVVSEESKFAWILGDWYLDYPAFPGNGVQVRLVQSGNTIIDTDNNLRWRGTIQDSGEIVWEVNSQIPICNLGGRWLSLKINFSADRSRATVISPTAMVGECVIKYPSYNTGEMTRN